MNKNIVKTGLMIAVFCFSLSIRLPVQAQTWMASYYENHPMSVETLKDSYGEPVKVIQMDNGIEKLIFGPKDVEIGYTYFLIKDGMVVDKNHTFSE